MWNAISYELLLHVCKSARWLGSENVIYYCLGHERAAGISLWWWREYWVTSPICFWALSLGFTVEKGKDLILLSLGVQKTKNPDLIISLQTISQLTGSGFMWQGALKRLFLSRSGSSSNPGTLEVQEPKIKGKLIKYQCPAQQNQGRSLDGK